MHLPSLSFDGGVKGCTFLIASDPPRSTVECCTGHLHTGCPNQPPAVKRITWFYAMRSDPLELTVQTKGRTAAQERNGQGDKSVIIKSQGVLENGLSSCCQRKSEA